MCLHLSLNLYFNLSLPRVSGVDAKSRQANCFLLGGKKYDDNVSEL